MSSGVYAITNTATGEQYIGATGNTQLRWAGHRALLRARRHNTKLQEAWDNFGSEAFRFEILEDVDGQEKLIEREQWHIRQRFERTGDHGYNVHTEPGVGLRYGLDTPDERVVSVNVFVSPEAKRMLRELGTRWYPNLKRPDGTVIEQLIRETYERDQKKK